EWPTPGSYPQALWATLCATPATPVANAGDNTVDLCKVIADDGRGSGQTVAESPLSLWMKPKAAGQGPAAPQTLGEIPHAVAAIASGTASGIASGIASGTASGIASGTASGTAAGPA